MRLIVEFGFAKPNSKIIDEKGFTLLNSLFYMTLIDSVSFLDEYDQYLGVKTESKFAERVKIVKKINKPLIAEIKKWKDLKSFRNQLLAHNLRKGKNGEFVFSVEDLSFDAPRTLNDLFLLSNLIQFSAETLNSEFAIELENFKNDTGYEIKYQDKILTKDDVSKTTITLLQKANSIKLKLNRNYDFTVKDFVW